MLLGNHLYKRHSGSVSLMVNGKSQAIKRMGNNLKIKILSDSLFVKIKVILFSRIYEQKYLYHNRKISEWVKHDLVKLKKRVYGKSVTVVGGVVFMFIELEHHHQSTQLVIIIINRSFGPVSSKKIKNCLFRVSRLTRLS